MLNEIILNKFARIYNQNKYIKWKKTPNIYPFLINKSVKDIIYFSKK